MTDVSSIGIPDSGSLAVEGATRYFKLGCRWTWMQTHQEYC